MVARSVKKTLENKTEPVQLEIVKLPKAQIREEIANLVAEAKAIKLRRQKILGEAKTLLNDGKEKLDRAEMLSAQVCSPRIQEQLEAAMASMEDDDEDDLEGRVMDQSNIKKPSDFMRGLEDSVNEAAENGFTDEPEDEE